MKINAGLVVTNHHRVRTSQVLTEVQVHKEEGDMTETPEELPAITPHQAPPPMTDPYWPAREYELFTGVTRTLENTLDELRESLDSPKLVAGVYDYNHPRHTSYRTAEDKKHRR
jgi:hypothetical protein